MEQGQGNGVDRLSRVHPRLPLLRVDELRRHDVHPKSPQGPASMNLDEESLLLARRRQNLESLVELP